MKNFHVDLEKAERDIRAMFAAYVPVPGDPVSACVPRYVEMEIALHRVVYGLIMDGVPTNVVAASFEGAMSNLINNFSNIFSHKEEVFPRTVGNIVQLCENIAIREAKGLSAAGECLVNHESGNTQ